MRSMLTAFVAITALALPAGLPAVALAAQTEVADDAPPPSDTGAHYQPDETSVAPTLAPPPAPRFEQPQVQDVQNRRGGGGGGGAHPGERTPGPGGEGAGLAKILARGN